MSKLTPSYNRQISQKQDKGYIMNNSEKQYASYLERKRVNKIADCNRTLAIIKEGKNKYKQVAKLSKQIMVAFKADNLELVKELQAKQNSIVNNYVTGETI